MKPRYWPYISAGVMLLSGIIMAFIALFLPPPGQIDDSVLYIFAQILIYAGSIFGIDAYVKRAIPPPSHRERHTPPEETRYENNDSPCY